jgi:hypothetical protein
MYKFSISPHDFFVPVGSIALMCEFSLSELNSHNLFVPVDSTGVMNESFLLELNGIGVGVDINI